MSYQFSLLLANETPLDDRVILPSSEHYADCLKEWKQCRFFGFDIETWAENGSALDPWRGSIRLVQIGLPSGRAIVADFGGIRGEHESAGLGNRRSEFLSILKERLENKSVFVIGANLSFDFLYVLVHWGIRARAARDVMLMSKVYWAGLTHFRHSLKAIAERLGFDIDKTEQKSDFGDYLTNAQLNYGAKDALLVIPIWQKLGQMLHDDNLAGSAIAECYALPGFVMMEYHGFPANPEKIDNLLNQYQDAAKKFLDQWRSDFPDINPDSPKVVQAAINEKFNLQLTGTAQSDLAPHYDIESIKALSLWRTMGTYIDYIRGCKNAYFNGSIRGSYQQAAPKGFGRSTCGNKKSDGFPNVNLQNPPNPLTMPSEIKSLGLPAVRSLFEVSDDKALIIADLSSAHARIACEISQDATLKAVYNDGKDMHAFTASGLAKLQGLDWTPDDVARIRGDKKDPQQPLAAKLRQAAKPTFYGSINLNGAATLANTAKVDAGIDMTVDEAKDAIKAWRSAYAGLWSFMQNAIARANSYDVKFPGSQFSYGINRGLSGRRLFMPKMKSDFNPEKPESVKGSDACSFIWTSTEADIIKLAIGRCVDQFDLHPEWDAWIVNCAHDELDIVCSKDHAEAVAKCVSVSMSAAMRVFIKSIPVDEGDDPKKSICKSWAEK